MLRRDLPTFRTASDWDIDRRILIALSYVRREVADPDAENALALSDREMDIVLNGASDEDESKDRRFWLW